MKFSTWGLIFITAGLAVIQIVLDPNSFKVGAISVIGCIVATFNERRK